MKLVYKHGWSGGGGRDEDDDSDDNNNNNNNNNNIRKNYVMRLIENKMNTLLEKKDDGFDSVYLSSEYCWCAPILGIIIS